MNNKKDKNFFLHIGANVSVRKADLVAIIDLDSATISKVTRSFLKEAEKSGRMTAISTELPRSMVFVTDGRVYLSHISAGTLCERLDAPLT